MAQVIELRPDRLAVYSYAHVPWLKPYQRSFEDKDLPSPELKLELFEKAHEVFKNSGYTSIGMDHFALPNDELAIAAQNNSLHRNFMGYSTHADAHQIGFGVSAISYVNRNYFQNLKEIPAYYEAIRRDQGLATHRGFFLILDDEIRRDLITQIMCHGKIDIQAFDKKWGITFKKYFEDALEDLIPMIEDGLLRIEDKQLVVLGDGFLFLRNIAMCFDKYLQEIRDASNNPVFSKTV
ncbi:MAG: hypothetical protein IPJ69_02495 [Deltaproteobacteria bacterium]|nr:MAG: hypothetical protein IPJ69_02495 [Deltaproteobacteria bacterium]